MNLIPDQPGRSPNYWCTWGAQHPIWDIQTEEELKTFDFLKATEGGNAFRQRMDQRFLLQTPGWATNYWPKVRSDLYLCLDDGWDVPPGIDATLERWRFGSLLLNEDRFPDFSGSPAERLRLVNEKVKSLGWRGIALWVAAQCEGDGRNGSMASPETCEAYWRERARWCNEAGIEYWKVDWGARCAEASFRRMLTTVAREEAPNLMVEHACCMDPVNNIENGRFGDWAMKTSLEFLSFSDVFRSYDAIEELCLPITLDRIATELQQVRMEPISKGIINCEDNLYMAAAMGFAMGIMRVPVRNPYTHWKWPKIDEASRALRWQRLAPAFGITANQAYVSDLLLADTFLVGTDFWCRMIAGRELEQHAPAAISRGLALPKVTCEGNPPYVVASRNPSGAIAIATLSRCLNSKPEYPLADVALDVSSIQHPVGIFGRFKSLTLRFQQSLAGQRIWAQDLLADKAQDVTSRVKFMDNAVMLDGSLINEVGRSAATADDPSDPGLVIKIGN